MKQIENRTFPFAWFCPWKDLRVAAGEIRKDAEALGIPFGQTPAVMVHGQIVFTGLARTEEIEAWLRTTLAVSRSKL